MDDFVTLHRNVLTRFMAIVDSLGGRRDLDEVLELIANAVVDVIGFDAVAVNIRTHADELQVRTVVGPPELGELRGGTMSHDGWLEILGSGEHWGDLRFVRTLELDDSVPHVDPWPERFVASTADRADDTEPWRPEFALLAPMWRAPDQLLGVISVDLPRSGRTPDADQRALLELFAGHAGAAVERAHAFEVANDRTSLYRTAFAASPAPTAILDRALRVIDVNGSLLDLTDALEHDLLGLTLADLVVLDEPQRVADVLAALASEQGVVVGEECALRHPRGHRWERWVQVAVRRVDGISFGARYVCIIVDRTDELASLNEMRRRAEHDELTGLKVRAVGLQELQRRCAALGIEPDGTRGLVALLFCDLDEFKAINDTDGHFAGDRALVAVAGRLVQEAATDDVVCRWGGDEFGVVATRRSVDDVLALADGMVDAVRSLAAASDADGPMRRLGLSVGVAVTDRATNPHDVVEAADAALYRSKAHATDAVHLQVL
ncbi:diguanylate cyclase domain-containing protein [Mycolicibacterium sp. 050158]|uniref:sensor domain-containing diguanylate cyclase n=1 Tax=Mycolicibacterium sp. 050158 TaxID=3090602 RepID=UPI00299DA1B3|nr:diguanylate cyclase [Mycolicibacterium sp. 050158]MDX1890390.1 diguanylate cyclase [Mycolicibacterium sp. 050158]